MPLLLSRNLGLDALQPLAAGIEDAPDPGPQGNGPPVINTYDPGVERWRDAVWAGMPDALKQGPDAALLLDKALHAIRGESGGNPSAVGDGGIAHGLFQSHYIGANASPQQQISDAWRLVQSDLANGGTGFGDWGEGRTYNGGSFGAFGRTPYGGQQTSGFGGITWGGGGPSLPASPSPAPPDLPDPSLFTGDSPISPMSAPNYGDVPYDAGMAALTQNTGDIPYAQGSPPSPGPLITQLGRQAGGFRGLENPADLEPGPNADYGIFDYNRANVRVPVLTPALEAAQSVTRPVVSSAVSSVLGAPLGGGLADVADRLGGERLPILGPVLRARREALNSAGEFAGEQAANLIPTRALDIGLTAAPLAGEAGRGLRAGRGALERGVLRDLGEEELGRAPAAAATAEERLAARGRVPPAGAGQTPEEELAFGSQPTGESTGMRPVAPGPEIRGNQPLSQVPTDELLQRKDATERVLNNFDGEWTRLVHGEGLSHTDPEVLSLNQERAQVEDVWTQINDELVKRGAYQPGTSTTGPGPSDAYRAANPEPTGQSVQQEFVPGETRPVGPSPNELRSAYSPFDKLMNAVSSAGQVPEANAAAFSEQRAQRTAMWYSARDRALAEGKSMAEATEAAKPYLRQTGEMTRADFEPLHQAFTPEDLNTLRSEPGYALDDGTLKGPYEVHNTQDALEKVLSGDFAHLQQHELDLLSRVYGPQLVDSIGQRTAEIVPNLRWDQRLQYVLGRGLQNLYSLINAPTSTATFGHFIPLRIGRGFALTNPEARRAAFQNFFKVLQNPENLAALREGRDALPFVGAEDSEAAQMGVRAKDFITRQQSPEPPFVDNLMAKLGLRGNRIQQATSEYLSAMRDVGYNEIAQRKWDEGVRDPLAYKDLWEAVSHATGHGLANRPQGPNPFFSANQLLAKWKTPLDLTKATPAARGVAAKSLMADFVAGISFLKFAEMTGLGDVNWDINGPGGLRLKVGASTVDPFAGYGSMMRLFGRLYDAASSGEGQFQKTWDNLRQYGQGQLSPGYGFLLDALTGKDYANRKISFTDALKDLGKSSEPIAFQSMKAAIEANGAIGGAIATPSLLGTSVETPDSLTAKRDRAAQSMGLQDYASASPTQRDQINKSEEIQSFTQAHPTDYEARKAEVQAPLDAKEQQAWDAFSRGENTTKITDIIHDIEQRRLQAGEDLSTQFASQFKNFSPDKYRQALDGYYDPKLSRTFADGTPDFDSTDKNRQAYLSKLPPDQQQWLKEAIQVTESHRSPERQKYDKYIADKKAAGYFDIKPTDSDYQAKHNALDVAHPDLDVQAWLYGGTKGVSGGELQTRAAVDQALKMNLPNRPIVLGSLDRDLSTPEGRKLWADKGAQLSDLAEGTKYAQAYGDREAQLQYKRGNVSNPRYADLPDNEKTKVLTAIRRSVLDGSPELEALWAYAGGGGNTGDKVYAVSREAVPYVQALMRQYGSTPPKEGWQIVQKK